MAGYFGPPIWLLLAVPYLLGVVVMAGVWAIRKQRSAKWSRHLPSCRRCGFAVLGLPAPLCPECGAGLTTTAAIVRPDTQGIRTAEMRIAGMTAVVWYPAVVAVIVTAPLSIWPVSQLATVSAELRGPTSGAYDRVSIGLHADGSLGYDRNGQAMIQCEELWPPRGSHLPGFPILIEFPSRRWHPSSWDPALLKWSDQPIDVAALATVMGGLGLAADPEALQAEAACMLDTVERLAAGSTKDSSAMVPFRQVDFGQHQVIALRPWWAPWPVVALGLAAWSVFAWLIWRGARRQALQRKAALNAAIGAASTAPRVDS